MHSSEESRTEENYTGGFFGSFWQGENKNKSTKKSQTKPPSKCSLSSSEHRSTTPAGEMELLCYAPKIFSPLFKATLSQFISENTEIWPYWFKRLEVFKLLKTL